MYKKVDETEQNKRQIVETVNLVAEQIIRTERQNSILVTIVLQNVATLHYHHFFNCNKLKYCLLKAKAKKRFILTIANLTCNTDNLGPIYTWRTLTGVKLSNNRTQYSSPEIFLTV